MTNGNHDQVNIDPTMNMSPMDLFDSIFWGKFLGLGVLRIELMKNRSVSDEWCRWVRRV